MSKIFPIIIGAIYCAVKPRPVACWSTWPKICGACASPPASVRRSWRTSLAAALGVAFVDLVQPPRQPHDSLRVLMWQSASQASRAVLLGAAPASRQVELWSWTLAPGERYDAQADQAGFSEMLYVLEGELQLVLAAGTRTLATGDFLVFSSAQAYAYVNAGVSTLRFTRNVAS